MQLRLLRVYAAWAGVFSALGVSGVAPATTPATSEGAGARPVLPLEGSAFKTALTEFFTAPTKQQETWKFPEEFEKLLPQNEGNVRITAWEAFRDAPIHESVKKDYASNQVRFDKHLSRYTVKRVGTRPTNGWALFIAMHGGGGGPKEMNDSQW